MNIIGIIMEANPLHNGHQYFIDKIIKEYSPDLLIGITSTSFTMRGEISVIDKFSKTSALLNAGVDLVLEFPFILSTQSSDYFSLNALTILNEIGITELICGCETDNLSVFKSFFDLECSDEFQNKFKNNLTKFTSYKKTYTITLQELGLDEKLIMLYNEPNFTLAYQYYKVITTNFNHIKFSLIKRTNHYDDLTLDEKIASAKAIREGLIKKQNIDRYVPFAYQYTNIKLAEDNLLKLLKYQLLTKKKISELINNEGIVNYLAKKINLVNSYQELVKIAVNKRYSAARINRTILYILNQVDKFYHGFPYLRILGLNKLGMKYLNTLSDNVKQNIFASIKEINEDHRMYEIAVIEQNASMLFGLITENNDFIQNEYKLPIRKKE